MEISRLAEIPQKIESNLLDAETFPAVIGIRFDCCIDSHSNDFDNLETPGEFRLGNYERRGINIMVILDFSTATTWRKVKVVNLNSLHEIVDKIVNLWNLN